SGRGGGRSRRGAWLFSKGCWRRSQSPSCLRAFPCVSFSGFNGTDHMRKIDLHDAVTCLTELLDQVEEGREFTITANGRPVARLAPPDPQAGDDGGVQAAIGRTIEVANRQP